MLSNILCLAKAYVIIVLWHARIQLCFISKLVKPMLFFLFFHCKGHKNPFSHQKSTRDLGPGEGGKERSAAESGGK